MFTLNNPTSYEIEFPAKVVYAKWQLEKVSTPHLQGYVEFDSVQRLSAVRKILDSAHWEPRKGTQQQALDYVSKSDSRLDGPWEYGSLIVSAQGKRSDLKRAMDQAVSGSSTLQLMEDNPSVMARYSGFINSYKRLKVDGVVRVNLKVHVYYGSTGTGKSRSAFEQYPRAYRKMSSNKWFDGYLGQKEVIWDDFDTTALDFRWFLTLIDIYPLYVEVKGSSVPFEPEVIILTTNVHPRDWFPELDEVTREPLYRRLQPVRDFNKQKIPLLGGIPLYK